MSEAPGHGPASGFDAAAADAPSAGTLLRQAREQAGLHVATLAAALKVPVRKLEALEADRFDELPDAVFVRALAASVCRNLKLDPAPVLERLPATGGPRLAPSEGGINAPFRSPRDGAAPAWREQLSRPVFIVVAALLLGALVVALLPLRHDGAGTEAAAPPPAPVPAPELVVASAEPTAAPAPSADPAPAVVTAAAPAASLAAATVPAAARPAKPASAAAATAAAAAAPAAAAASASGPAATGIVVFKARGESWIQVTDAKGGVPLRKLLTAGESAGASGPLPLAVTVGSVSATDVQVRGKPFDLAPVSRDNVARFEVK
ncbi:helix-turn-helix domain-containing protein [Caenimonas terrae]|uniref:Helix-turn-helix domain-containing protein n=1 Tax=Caenimonas terrae TaxID=696074 RepID=A0ABW0NIC8_9BURK